MLLELRIAGLGVIEAAEVELGPGLTVVTGETGAGKTMVVSALLLATGGRADASRVRAGSPRAAVEARFDLTDRQVGPAVAVAEAAGGQLDHDGSLLVVRTVTPDGRSRAHLGGRSVPAGTLAEAASTLVAVHGQQEAIALLQPARQRAVLDRFAGAQPLLTAYQRIRDQWLEVRDDLRRRLAADRDRLQREDLLRRGLAEIEAVAPEPAEDDRIRTEVRRLENVDSVRGAAAAAIADLAGSDESAGPDTAAAATALGLLVRARRALDGALDELLTSAATRLQDVQLTVADVAADLSGFVADLDADPERLQRLLERQAALRSLTRRYGDDLAAVDAWAQAAHAELATLDSSEHVVAQLREHERRLRGELLAAGDELSRARRAAADRLSVAATQELSSVAMGAATLRVAVHSLDERAGADPITDGERRVVAGSDGFDQVAIMLSSHVGAPELPIQRSASGGELSRVMLALEVVLAGADPVPTLVFDEVDTGVGGRTASDIGAVLARLAHSHQVVVVTHLAQVAAFADRHVVVEPTADGSVRASAVRLLDEHARVVELARMLGGTSGDTAMRHAADLRSAAIARAGEAPAAG